jgi:quinol monooxygenase YgiN
MAITINIYYKGKNGNAKKFAQEMISCGFVNEIRAESGNLRYEYFLPFDDNDTVLLIDSWKDQHSLDVHHNLPIMQKIAELRKKYDLTMQVERFIKDETLPESDKKYIRS